ncbi:hypothetical protein CSB37_03755 [bacterium DOLZORAL124_38_8]|nr:MAG: hypothetical protein CSB37_03755 [bacterium DOLZORAL124_38_8]
MKENISAKKVFVFIDVANVWNAQKSKSRFIDYPNLKKVVTQTLSNKIKIPVQIDKIFYYEAYPLEHTRQYDTDPKHKFLTFLKKGLEFVVRKKPIKQIHLESNQGSYIQEKGNMDIELAIDAVHHSSKYDIAIFFSGDSDFFPLIKYLNNRKKLCFVFSSKNNVSKELRTGTNGYFDILDLPIWGRKIKYRQQKK